MSALPLPSGWYALGPAADVAHVREHRFCGTTLTVVNDHAHVGGKPVPLLRRSGLVFAWYHPDHQAPSWELERLDDAGWTPMTFTHQDLPVHPLLVMRDLADLAHFESVHRYWDVTVRRPLTVDGPRLDTAIDFGWDTGIPGLKSGFPAGFEARVEGPGYQRTDVTVRLGEWQSRHLVLPTPLADGVCRVHLGMSIRPTGRLASLEQRLGPRTTATARRAIHTFLARMFERDVARDVEMWVRLPQEPARGAPRDEAFARYYAWQAQFLERSGHAAST